MLGAIYAVLASRADDTPISDREFRELVLETAREQGLPPHVVAPEIDRDLREAELERRINRETLAQLRTIAPIALLGLLILSLAIAYLVAGRVLAPVTRIASRARALADRAPDLSGRINLGGPDDELRDLADTLDDLLDRSESALVSQRGFLADASHELRTPLAAAQTNLDVALANTDASAGELRHAAAVARGQIGRLSRMVGDLLALERGTSGRPAVLSLRGVCEAVITDLSPAAAEREVTVTLEPGPDVRVRFDPDDLRRVLTNLIENGIVHNDPGGEVRLSLTTEAARAHVRVADDGPGIPPGEEQRIFDRFHRASRAAAGTGLGLAIVRELVEAGGGEVMLDSVGARGARFLVSLPAA